MRTSTGVAAGVAALLLLQATTLAKVAPASLANLVRTSDFIGIVRVNGVSGGIPLLRKRRASATILQSWTGQRTGEVSFIAQPTWACDISDARRGEEVVVFIQADRLALAGRGRMPILRRDDRRYVAMSYEIRLPASMAATTGSDRGFEMARLVPIDELAAEVSSVLTNTPAPSDREGTGRPQ